MGLGFLLSISCLIGTIALGLSLAVYNNKRLKETHEFRMAQYRQRKKQKNEALRRYIEAHRDDLQI